LDRLEALTAVFSPALQAVVAAAAFDVFSSALVEYGLKSGNRDAFIVGVGCGVKLADLSLALASMSRLRL